MKTYTRVYAPINLDAVCHNMESMRHHLAQKVHLMGVVKTDAYGHGAVPVAQTIAPYVDAYAVASVEEGLLLRRHGVEKPILILGVTHPSDYKRCLEHQIRLTIFTTEQAKLLSHEAEQLQKKARIHFAVDTGMNRIGMRADEAGADLAAQIAGLPQIEVEGVFTHFAKADEADKAFTNLQIARYQKFVKLLEERGITVLWKHCANSAGIIDLPNAEGNLMRAGISIYGIYPSDEVDHTAVSLKPAMGLKSFVTYVKPVAKGEPVSYGGRFVADRPLIVATVPVGYGDGYPRSLSGKGYVLIHGKKAPILGRVCMDQFMVDVTDIPEVGVDTEVTLLGKDGEECITVELLAELSGGFHYEILCDIGKRVPRVYIKNGSVIGTKDYFDDRYEDFL